MRIAKPFPTVFTLLPVLLLTAAGASAQTFTVSPTSVLFAAAPGSTTPLTQTVSLNSGDQASFYFSSINYTSGSGWLTVDPPYGGFTGGRTVNLMANPTGLAQGTYTAQVTFSTNQAPQGTVQVTLDLTGAPRLVFSQGNNLTFTDPVTGVSETRLGTLTSSVAGQQLSFGNPTSNRAWLGAAVNAFATPANLTIFVSPSLLVQGTQSGQITVPVTGGSPLVINVTATVSGGATGLTPFPASVSSSYVIGGTLPASQLVSATSATGAYTVSAAALTGTTQWLTISQTAGGTPTSQLTNLASGTGFFVNFNPAGLAANTYQGQLTFSNATSIVNVPVSFTVSAAGSSSLVTNPASLSFNFPGAVDQLLSINSGTVAQVTFSASFQSCISGISPFLINNTTALNAITTPAQVTISVSPFVAPTLAAGTYSCFLALTPNVAGAAPTTVGVTLVVGTGGGTGPLIVSQQQINLSGTPGSTVKPSAQVNVSTVDTGVQSFSAIPSSTGNWLSVVPDVAFISPGFPAAIQIFADTLNLAAGTYTGTVTLRPFSGAADSIINVTLTVGGSTFTITANPAQPTFTLAQNAAAQSQTVTLSVSDNQPTTFSASVASGFGWLTVSPSSGNIPGTITVTANPAGLLPTTYTGSITIVGQRGGQQATLNLPVSLVVTAASSITLSSTSLSFSAAGSAPPNQTITLSSTSATAIPFTALAISTGGWLSVTPGSGQVSSGSPQTLTVAVNPSGLNPGNFTGTVQISGGGTTQTVNVGLTVTQPTGPRITQVFNAASFQPTLIAPGLIITITGTNLGPQNGRLFRLNAQGNLDTTVEGVRVFFDGIPAPLLYVQATQINAIVPYAVFANLSTRIVVEHNGVRSDPVDRRVEYAQPGIFSLTQTGTGQGAILNQNSTVNATGNPAARGSVLQIFATGEGQTSPAGEDGKIIGTDLRRPLRNVVVRIGGLAAEVRYAGSAPGQVSGLFQVNAVVPTGLSAGNHPVEIEIGEFRSQTGLTVAISNQLQ